MSSFSENDRFRKKFEILFRKFHDNTARKLHGNRPPENGWNDALFWWQKRSQNAVFSAPFCTVLAEGAKSLKSSVPHDPTSPCKISSQWVPICWRYSRKSDLVRSQNIPSAYNRTKNKIENTRERYGFSRGLAAAEARMMLIVHCWHKDTKYA